MKLRLLCVKLESTLKELENGEDVVGGDEHRPMAEKWPS